MREIRPSGSEGGRAEPNRHSLPYSNCEPRRVMTRVMLLPATFGLLRQLEDGIVD